VRLEKRIPIAAGLGGGSSDAAAAMDAALEAWGVADTGVLREVAAEVGSDVPFLVDGGLALVEGRGEAVAPLRPPVGDSLGILLVTPGLRVSTHDVFDAYVAGARPTDGGGATRAASVHLVEELGRGMTTGSLLGRAGIMAVANDLMPAAAIVAPGLTRFRRELSRLLRRPVGQSGSGPTLWALYPSEIAAGEGADATRAALAAGTLEPPGAGAPSVTATTLETGGTDR
jgi:4-diphosphocytidyl-2-C-methyl-D-erythritol kinase